VLPLRVSITQNASQKLACYKGVRCISWSCTINKDRVKRLLLGFALPPVLGALCISLIFLISGRVSMAFSLLIISIPFAFFLTGIQSIIFSFIMEYLILAKASDVTYVIISGVILGVLSSFFLSTMFCVIGAIVGGLSSYLLFRRYNTANKQINRD